MAQVPPTPPPPPPHVPGVTGGRITERAGFWQRFLAALIDGLIIGAVQGVLAAVFNDPLFDTSRNMQTTDYLLFRTTVAGTIGFALASAYSIYFHGSGSGQTIGKKLLSIRVVGFDDGGPIGYGRSTLRYIGTFLSRLPCGLGYLWMLWDNEKQTWHDKIANTIVVPESAAPVSNWPG